MSESVVFTQTNSSDSDKQGLVTGYWSMIQVCSLSNLDIFFDNGVDVVDLVLADFDPYLEELTDGLTAQAWQQCKQATFYPSIYLSIYISI